LSLCHKLFFCFHCGSKWNKELLIITPMGSFYEIFFDIPIRIVAINFCIELFKYIIPILLFLFTSREEFCSSVSMNPNVTCNSMIAEMRENIHKKLKSKSRAFSSGICHKSRSRSNINIVPFVYWKVFIEFEILIYLYW